MKMRDIINTVEKGLAMLVEASSLSNARKYKWTRQSNSNWEAKFFVGNHEYWFTARESHNFTSPIWTVYFGISKEDSISLHGPTHSMVDPTGLGTPFRVMATVMAIFKDFINQKQPQTLWFEVDTPVGKKLMQRISDLLVRDYGYEEVHQVMQRFAKEGINIWMLRKSSA